MGKGVTKKELVKVLQLSDKGEIPRQVKAMGYSPKETMHVEIDYMPALSLAHRKGLIDCEGHVLLDSSSPKMATGVFLTIEGERYLAYYKAKRLHRRLLVALLALVIAPIFGGVAVHVIIKWVDTKRQERLDNPPPSFHIGIPVEAEPTATS